MTDIEVDSPSSLGDAIKQLNSSEHEPDEKARIHLLLMDQNSKVYRRTRKWCLLNKLFERRSRKWAKEIKGFRVNHWRYKVEAFGYMVRQMAHDQRAIGWLFYEMAYIDHLVENKIELGQLLADEESEGLTSSDDLIRAVIDKAPKYNVTAIDICDLYENWYFKRNSEFGQWIQGLEKIGRSIENQRHISEIESDLDKLVKDIALIKGALEKKKSDEKGLELLGAQITDIQTHFAGGLADLRDVSTNLSKQKDELSEKITQLQTDEKELAANQNTLKSDLEKSISNSRDYIEERISTLVGGYKKAIHDSTSALNQKINDLDIRPPQAITEKQKGSHFIEKNKTIIRAGTGLTEASIDEREFITTYQQSLEFSAIETTTKIPVINHCILKSSAIICCRSLDYVDAWVRALNWEQHVLEAAVDPNWTNYAAWQDVAITFVSDPSIRLLVLHSYNKGYVEGYLNPFLLLFRRERYTHKKIILVEAGRTPKASLSGVGLALIENHKIEMFKDPSTIFESIAPVSLDSFDKWLTVKSEESKDHAHDICQDIISFAANENINMQTAELEEIYLVLCAYLDSESGLSQKIKTLLFTALLSNLWEEEFVNKFIEGI